MTYAALAKAARDWAVSKIGSRYSQARRTQQGIFDCSSLVARAFGALGKAWGYKGPVPISCYEVYDDDFELLWPESYAVIGDKFGGSSVIAKARQPGDLQFLNTMATGRANKITHITMVSSASKIVHARGTAFGVRTDKLTQYAGKVYALTRYNPACDLMMGHKGNRTKALQAALNSAINAGLNGDGEFGEKTRNAIKRLQRIMGLEITGKGDAATRAALGLADQPSEADEPTTSDGAGTPTNAVLGARVLKLGDEGADVIALQEGFLTLGGAAAGYGLGAYGEDKDGVDGQYGALTAACVLLLQTRSNIPGTGIFDAATFTAFAFALAALLADAPHEPADDAADEPEETIYPDSGFIPDSSSNQETFYAAKVAQKCAFAILRARVSGRTDPKYNGRAAALLELDFPHWDYDYLKTVSIADAVKQADAMYDLCKRYKPQGYYLDVETLAEGVTYAESREHIRTYVFHLRMRAAADGVTIKIGSYMGTSRHDSHYKQLDGLFDTLWPAAWGDNDGNLSRLPEYGDLHQYTSMYPAKEADFGIPGARDMSRLTGRKPLSYFTGREHDGDGYNGVAKVTASSVNIRSGASAGADRLGRAAKGDLFDRRAGDVEGWTAIYYRGKKAFVSAQYVALITG